MSDFSDRTHLLSLGELRENYTRGGLLEQNCDSNPIAQFETWFKEAQVVEKHEPNAMTLATADSTGKPSARVVLLKEVSDIGFVFYTNYTSRKGQDCKTNPFAALAFYWPELQRQVRVEGRVEQVDRATSESYFRTRPVGSRVGAWISKQSQPVGSRREIEASMKEAKVSLSEYAPPFWGGYRVIPDLIEFWQGRPNRLHDRIVYRKREREWQMERLWP